MSCPTTTLGTHRRLTHLVPLFLRFVFLLPENEGPTRFMPTTFCKAHPTTTCRRCSNWRTICSDATSWLNCHQRTREHALALEGLPPGYAVVTFSCHTRKHLIEWANSNPNHRSDSSEHEPEPELAAVNGKLDVCLGMMRRMAVCIYLSSSGAIARRGPFAILVCVGDDCGNLSLTPEGFAASLLRGFLVCAVTRSCLQLKWGNPKRMMR